MSRFFSENYKPKKEYYSYSYYAICSTQANLDILVAKGYDKKKAEEALRLTGYEVGNALNYLETGVFNISKTEQPYLGGVSPLILLTLELVDIFFELFDHCCQCGKKLEVSGFKPSVCDTPLCLFGLQHLGNGASVTQEIRRDPDSADLVISLFSAALDTQYLIPKPPESLLPCAMSLLKKLPHVSDIMKYPSDLQFSKLFSENEFNLLRWILFSNRSHLISLPCTLR